MGPTAFVSLTYSGIESGNLAARGRVEMINLAEVHPAG